MKKRFRKSVFVIVYSKEGNNVRYLVLKRKLHWHGWEFPKGGIKCFEAGKMAVKREVKEETGLKPFNIKKYNLKGEYRYNKEYSDRPSIIGQKWKLYSAEVKNKKIKIDRIEHSSYKWLDFERGLKRLTWRNQRECLKIVNLWLKTG